MGPEQHHIRTLKPGMNQIGMRRPIPGGHHYLPVLAVAMFFRWLCRYSWVRKATASFAETVLFDLYKYSQIRRIVPMRITVRVHQETTSVCRQAGSRRTEYRRMPMFIRLRSLEAQGPAVKVPERKMRAPMAMARMLVLS